MFTLVWLMAGAGVVFKWYYTGHMSRFSTFSYVAMGWVAIFGGPSVLSALPSDTANWVVAGGLAYTLGVGVFVSSMPWAHSVWHLFVLAGSTCHFFGILARVSVS
jgi:hemolysin III